MDGLRGVMAIGVVLGHCFQMARQPIAVGSWMAVDIFFLMSGFVIAHVYVGKIGQGYTFSKFAAARLRRLYPMYAIGFGLGIVDLWCEGVFQKLPDTVVAISIFLGGIISPYFNSFNWAVSGGSPHRGVVFPINDPAWSLFWELVVNVIFFVCAATKLKDYRRIVLVGALVWYLISSFRLGFHTGWSTGNFWGALPRVTVMFFAGWVIHDLHGRFPIVRLRSFMALLVLTLICFLFYGRPVQMFVLLGLGPAIVLVASRVSPAQVPPRMREWMHLTGLLSYPLYIIHFPISRMTWFYLGSHVPSYVFVFIAAGLSCMVACLAISMQERLFTKPALASLNN